MKKLKLKPYIKNTLIISSILLCAIITYSLFNIKTEEVSKELTYVNDYIFDKYYPVVKEEEKIQNPYSSSKVKIDKNYYETESSKEEQESSIIFYDGTYMQNSGVHYMSDETFDVIAMMSGTVSNVTDDPLLGKSVEIRNSNELIVMYQSLSEINLKKGDIVSQGQVIGKSGSCKLYGEIANGLQIEMYKNGTIINPIKTINKSIKEIMDNN